MTVNDVWKFLYGMLLDSLSHAKGAGIGIHMELPSGYNNPQPTTDNSRDILDCTAYLQEKWPLLKANFETVTGRQLILTCTYRSEQIQNELYQKGRRDIAGERIVTKLDGFTKKSRHNFYPAQAFDVAVDIDPGIGKHISWDEAAYEPLGAICQALGLRWGGDFNMDGDYSNDSFRDLPHIEQHEYS